MSNQHMEMNYCRRCGQSLQLIEGNTYRCNNGHTIFANSAPCAGVFFMQGDDEVLLSIRGIEPHKGMLHAFGGFAYDEERAEDTISREVQEELQITPNAYEPLRYLTSGIGHYEFEGDVLPTCAVFYWTRLKPGSLLKPADDIAGVTVVKLHEVDLNDLDDEDIRAGIRALRELFPKSDRL